MSLQKQEGEELGRLLQWVSGRPSTAANVNRFRNLLLGHPLENYPQQDASAKLTIREMVEPCIPQSTLTASKSRLNGHPQRHYSFGKCTFIRRRSSSIKRPISKNLISSATRFSSSVYAWTQEWSIYRQSFGKHLPSIQRLPLNHRVLWDDGRFALTVKGKLPLALPQAFTLALRSLRPDDIPSLCENMSAWTTNLAGFPNTKICDGIHSMQHTDHQEQVPTVQSQIQYFLERVPGAVRDTIPVVVLVSTASIPFAHPHHGQSVRFNRDSNPPIGNGADVLVCIPGLGLQLQSMSALSFHLEHQASTTSPPRSIILGLH